MTAAECRGERDRCRYLAKREDPAWREYNRARAAHWYAANKARASTAARRYVAAHKEKTAAYQSAYKVAHRDELYAKERERQATSPKAKAYKSAWAKSHREQISARASARRRAGIADALMREAAARETHREQIRANLAKWKQANPEKMRMWRRESARIRKARKRACAAGAPIGNLRQITEWERSWRHREDVECAWCHRVFTGAECHADHIVPLSKGGAHALSNLAIACKWCNASKQDMMPAEWQARLARIAA